MSPNAPNVSFTHQFSNKTKKESIIESLYETYANIKSAKNISVNECYKIRSSYFIEKLNISSSINIEMSNRSKESLQQNADTLIVFTTCNYVQNSINALSYIAHSINKDRHFELVIIDDHSTDETFNILTKLGFAVIENSNASGLTYSWNIGYKLANFLNMSHIIFINNDVIIPHGALQQLRYALKKNALVAPTTTTIGAGIEFILKLSL
jgi:hypothetical protein